MFTEKFSRSIFLFFILFGCFLFSAGVVYAHGGEEHIGLVSEVDVCHALSETEREACYASLCEEGMTRECAEDVIDAAMEGSGPKFTTAVLQDLDYYFAVDAYALAQRMGRYLVDTGFFLDCLHDFHYGCYYGFFQESFSRIGDETGHAPLNSMIEFCGAHQAGDPAVRLKRGKCHYHAGKTFAAATAICDIASAKGDGEACYHQIGHMFMKHYDFELAPALAMCSALPSVSQAHCWDGVFMENVNEFFFSDGEEGDGFLADEPLAPCTTVTAQYRERCYMNHGEYLTAWFAGSSLDVSGACSGAGAYAEVCRHSIQDFSSGADSHHAHDGEVSSWSWFRKIIDFIVGLFSGDGSSGRDGVVVLPDPPAPGQFAPAALPVRPVPVVLPLSRTFPIGVLPGEEEYSVVIFYRDGQYVPNEVRISPGQTVLWRNEDQVFWPASNLHPTHTEYPGSGMTKCDTDERLLIFDACEAMGPDTAYSFQFNEVGEWKFHDHINPKATGTVIVSR